MAIEKMSLINLVGNINDLDKTLLRCLTSGYFHPEMAIHTIDPQHGFHPLEGENPYIAPLNNVLKLATDLKLDLKKAGQQDGEMTLPAAQECIDTIEDEISSLVEQEHTAKENISQYEQAIIQLKHLAGLDSNFDNIFACQYVKVRFGRLPYDSYPKLSYYENKTFFFFPFDNDKKYYWGVYFAPASTIAEIDEIFTSLYFERMRVPDYAHGTPEVATANINALLSDEKKNLEEIRKQIAGVTEEYGERLNEIYSFLQFHNAVYNLRKYVATYNDRFYAVGFVPDSKKQEFVSSFNSLESVDVVANPDDADPSLDPPVKLKNNWFTRPFEQFVQMYSLPSHRDVDPTSFFAITYTLLFGVMFGDLGQGLLIALIGIVLSKWKKMNFGKILTRIGISSAIFGTAYGSVFGYEHLLDPMFHALGFAEKPIEVFDSNMTNILLLGAIAIGVLLIVISIGINIYTGFRAKDYESAIFGNNGIAGLIFYLAAAFAIVDMMVLHIGVLNAGYILGLLVLPLLLIFFKGPLAKLMARRKDIMEGQSIGEFIIENFFELFEYVLSYLSNSMSFLRVGGFILSHAGMMAVVMSLSEMVGSVGSPFVVVIGNLFVMALEGLIVGIQVLRLEFYEIFSRNFEGNGKPFEPATVNYNLNK